MEQSETRTAQFRIFLQEELVKRTRANPRYSLRAFAKWLRIEPSHLSKILKGQRPIRTELFEQFASRLDLDPAETEKFKERRSTDRDYKQISLDAFEVISDWHHYAILELMKIEGFASDLKWVAKKLEMSIEETRACVDRLVRVGILSHAPDGKWVDKSEGFSTDILGENHTSHAQRRFQQNVLEQAIRALNSVAIEHRDNTSIMMASHPDRIAGAKIRIRNFRRSLCEYLESAPKKTCVYQMSIALHPLTTSSIQKTGYGNITKKRSTQ